MTRNPDPSGVTREPAERLARALASRKVAYHFDAFTGQRSVLLVWRPTLSRVLRPTRNGVIQIPEGDIESECVGSLEQLRLEEQFKIEVNENALGGISL